jgi:organic radical activating enzyme
VNGECCKAGQGSWTVFVRTFGCSAKCSYCDTQYSHEEKTLTEQEKLKYDWGQADYPVQYEEMHPADVFAEIVKLDPGCKRVTLTGGEPLEQDTGELIKLIEYLSGAGYEISIETNGMQMDKLSSLKKAIEWRMNDKDDYNCPYKISFVVDIKLPSSGKPWQEIVYGGSPLVTNKADSDKLIARNLVVYSDLFKRALNSTDLVKFVISNKEDFDTAMQIANKLPNIKKYFSPCGLKAPGLLFDWMKEAGCAEKDIGYSMQIHKVIFPGDWRDEEK